MAKNDYIKVSGHGYSKVVLAANAPFYREQKYQIEQPTEEEIKAEFPDYQIEALADADPAEEVAPKQKRTYNRKS